MKVHILFKFVDGPWGGGNQFLKALRNEFRKMGVYAEKPEDTDVLLINSYPFGWESEFLKTLFRLKKNKAKLITVHRIDGPTFLIRGTDIDIDRFIFYLNHRTCDGTIFQSGWSRKKCYELGLLANKHEKSILNAPDNNIFFRRKVKTPSDHIWLIATSWSSNPQKGFAIYRYLDQNLDFSRYTMTFVGNSPIVFENIICIPAVSTDELADILQSHDIYIAASKNDPCSNSLIEALSCGLPAVVLNSGGHPEIIRDGGVVFESQDDVLEQIDAVAGDLKKFARNISCFDITKTAKQYYAFCEGIFKECESGKNRPKQFSLFYFFVLFSRSYCRRIAVKLYHLK